MNSVFPNPVQLAVERAGGTVALARALKVSSQAVSQWTRVPVERVLEIEALTGIERSVLRPDIYPPASVPEAAA